MYFTWKDINFVEWVITRNVNVIEMTEELPAFMVTRIKFDIRKGPSLLIRIAISIRFSKS